MKYLDEYRDEKLARKIADDVRWLVTRPWARGCGKKRGRKSNFSAPRFKKLLQRRDHSNQGGPLKTVGA